MPADASLRILDANLNRAKEGLRVCEEIFRFMLDDEKMTADLKKLRHAITRAMQQSKVGRSDLLRSRNSAGDVGREASALENSKKNLADLWAANFQRVKEAMRVLEEVSKLKDAALSRKFKKIRFEVYELEKTIDRKLGALSRHRRHSG